MVDLRGNSQRWPETDSLQKPHFIAALENGKTQISSSWPESNHGGDTLEKNLESQAKIPSERAFT
jgi:hypothetical protein